MWQAPEPSGKQAVSPQAAFLTTDILAGNTDPSQNPIWAAEARAPERRRAERIARRRSRPEPRTRRPTSRHTASWRRPMTRISTASPWASGWATATTRPANGEARDIARPLPRPCGRRSCATTRTGGPWRSSSRRQASSGRPSMPGRAARRARGRVRRLRRGSSAGPSRTPVRRSTPTACCTRPAAADGTSTSSRRSSVRRAGTPTSRAGWIGPAEDRVRSARMGRRPPTSGAARHGAGRSMARVLSRSRRWRRTASPPASSI